MRPNIPSLTGLRFVAAGIIVANHLIPHFWLDPKGPMQGIASRLPHVGMTLFFVLSGFVIHYNYGDSLRSLSASGIWSFISARIARLYPLFLVAVLFDLAARTTEVLATHTEWSYLPYYFTLSHSWFPIHSDVDGRRLAQMFAGGSWSISTEFLMYVMYIALSGLIFLANSRRRILAALVLLFITSTIVYSSHSAGLWHPSDDVWAFYLSPYGRFAEFLLGALTSALLTEMGRHQLAPSRGEQLVGYLAFAASCAWLGGLWLAYDVPTWSGFVISYQRSWGFAPACAGLIFYVARYRTILSILLENRLSIALGDASYSIYLIGSGYFFNLFGGGDGTETWMLAFRLVLTLAVIGITSIAFHSLIEKPARVLVRRLLNRPSAAVARTVEAY